MRRHERAVGLEQKEAVVRIRKNPTDSTNTSTEAGVEAEIANMVLRTTHHVGHITKDQEVQLEQNLETNSDGQMTVALVVTSYYLKMRKVRETYFLRPELPWLEPSASDS